MGETLVKIGPNDAGMHLTRDEFATADEVGACRYERVNGRLTVMAPPGDDHREVSSPFRRRLDVYWDEHPGLIDAVDEEAWLATSEESDRRPDLAVYLAGGRARERRPHWVPELIVEFVSPDRADQERDYISKRAEYHAVGLREYVIVDRFEQQVLVLTWAEGDFAENALGPSENYSTPLLPGLAVDLREVFARR